VRCPGGLGPVGVVGTFVIGPAFSGQLQIASYAAALRSRYSF
jgi:hypothetical protein